MSSRFLPALIAAALAGCAISPDYQRPASELPGTWSAAAEGAQPASKAGAEWWKVYGDARLDRVVEDALAHNADLALAVARVDEARAQLGIVESNQSVEVDGSFNRSRSQSSAATGPQMPGMPRERNDYRAALNISYELDLWGRLRSATAAARADLLATEAARETVRTALAAQVVQTWYALQALDEQTAATRRAVASRGEGVGLQKKRYEAGVISGYELGQLQSELAAAEAQLPGLERRRLQAETALAVLLGRSPRHIYAINGERPASKPAAEAKPAATPVVIPEGLPSDLLLRRPDIVAAEQRLIAMNARIAQARASLFPAISLTGVLGSQSAALGDLFTGPAGIWSLAAGVLQPIFAGGRLKAGIAAAESRERQAVIQYQQTLQVAFKEVRDALDGQTQARRQLDAETRRADSLRDNYRLARLRYENGVSSLLDVLDAERNLLAAELNRAEALRAQRAAVADLFKALGGGWEGAGN
jgi:multidrug efflux system outer membrane protein